MSEKIGKIAFFSSFFQFKLIFRKIPSVSRTAYHMILKFNLSSIRKNKNFEIETCGFRDINFRKFLSQNQEKQ